MIEDIKSYAYIFGSVLIFLLLVIVVIVSGSERTFAPNLITQNISNDYYLDASSFTGWADYTDNVYNASNTFSVTGGVDTIIPNNALIVRDSQKPIDVISFYNGSQIISSQKDSLAITIEFKAVPQSVSATRADVWFDIGGGIGQLYRRTVSFSKGSGVVNYVTFTTDVYTLDTWEDNGATIYINANDDIEIYDIRYVVYRLHKGRN